MNSRRGVDVRPTDLSQPTDLFGAAKFTGQNGNLRYGALLASEDDTEIQGTYRMGREVNLQATGRDFTVGRLLYEDTSGGVTAIYRLDGHRCLSSRD